MQNDIIKPPSSPPQEPDSTSESIQVRVQAETSNVPPQQLETTPEQPAQTEQTPESKPSAEPVISHKTTKPIGVIITAVFICTGLAGGAIYGGAQKTGEFAKAPNAPASNQSATATETDIAQEVDAALNDTNSLQESAQDLSTDMSDASLGL